LHRLNSSEIDINKNYRLWSIFNVLVEEKQLLKDYINLIEEILAKLKLPSKEKTTNGLLEMSRRRVGVKYIKFLIFNLNN
jgi:hypothetical protein